MSTPYGIFWNEVNGNQIAATGGTLKIIEVPGYGQGYLRHLLINDMSEAPDGYTVDVYCSSAAFNDPPTALSAAADMFTVIPRQTVAALSRIMRLDTEYAFANADGGHTERERKLYLVINPSGTGAKLFDMAMIIIPPTRAI